MHCSSAPQLDYRFPSSVPVSEALKDLLRRVFVSTREARVGLAGLAAHPWVTDDGSLPPIATVPAAAGGPHRLLCYRAGQAQRSVDHIAASA